MVIFTLVSNSGNINCDVGPIDRVHGSGTHGAHSLVGGMESIKNGFTECKWDHNPLVHKDHTIHDTETGRISMKRAKLCRQLHAICWESYFEVVDEVDECPV